MVGLEAAVTVAVVVMEEAVAALEEVWAVAVMVVAMVVMAGWVAQLVERGRGMVSGQE